MSDDQCTEVGGLHGEPLRQCMLRDGHGGVCEFPIDVQPLQERGPEQCPATTQTGFGVVRCQLPPRHPEHHTNQAYQWYNGYPDSRTPPVPVCTDTIWVNDRIGTVACSLSQGHTSDHTENTTGRALHWPLVDRCLAPDPEHHTENPTEPVPDPEHHTENPTEPVPDPEPAMTEDPRRFDAPSLVGVDRDDLVHNLFKRVEQLEQVTKSQAAWLKNAAPRIQYLERLSHGLGEIERRMTELERLDRGTKDPTALGHVVVGVQQMSRRMDQQLEQLNGAICTVNSDARERHGDADAQLRSLQSALMNHTNQAMAEFGVQLVSIIDDMSAKIISALKPPLKVICGAPDLNGHYVCELDPGHEGRHYYGTSTWPWGTCRAQHPLEEGVTCLRPDGHATDHKSASRMGQRFVWPNPVKLAPDQEERASASPAPTRCPSQFREGQCLGYAGHDGECTAVPGTAADYQLEEPVEFAESTYDRSSDGTPLEESR